MIRRGTDEAGALFDESESYRYALWRDWQVPWERRRKTLAFVMLNPSTADERDLDPTVRRCMGYAKRWGYTRLHVVNLFALRSTDPDVLLGESFDDPDNLSAIALYAGDQSSLAIAAWGAHRMVPADAFVRVRNIVQPRALRVLGVTKSGQPRHPLYMPKDCGHHAPEDLTRADTSAILGT